MSVEKFTVTREPFGYTCLPNLVLQGIIDLEPLGLWCHLASRPPEWTFYKDEIKLHFGIGRDKLETLLRVLKKQNLIEIKSIRNEKGVFTEFHLHVKNGTQFLAMMPKKPRIDAMSIHYTENPVPGSPVTGKPTPIKKEEKRKIKTIKKDLILPEWISDKIWNDFIEHRKLLKPPLTDQAKRLAITKLTELKDKGQNIDDVVNQTILNGWKGLFPIRKANQGDGYANKRKSNSAIHSESVNGVFIGTIYETGYNPDEDVFR